jgi:hypothetical protein
MPLRQALAVIALLCIWLLPLSACVYSHRDLADELAPEFPLADGAYLDEKGADLHVEKVGQLYRVTTPDDEITRSPSSVSPTMPDTSFG